MANKMLKKTRFSVSIIFLIHGMIIATWVSRIPAFKLGLHLSSAVLGKSLMLIAIGSLFSMPTTGWLISCFGCKKLGKITTLGFCFTLLLIAQAHTIFELSMALLIFGAFAGAMDVAMNTYAVALETQYKRPLMSSLHALFSLGGMLGSALGGLVASVEITPVIQFRVTGLILMGVAICAFFWIKMPEPVPEQNKNIREKRSIKLNPTILALGSIAFCIMLGEGAMADWTAVYLQYTIHTDSGFAALGYAAFSLAMALGRILGDPLTEKWGRFRLIRYGSLLASLGLSFSLLTSKQEWAIFGFILVGAGFATIVPNIFAEAGRLEEVSPESGLATVSTIGYVGFLSGPPLIGVAAEYLTLRAALWIVVGLSVIGTVLSKSIQRTHYKF